MHDVEPTKTLLQEQKKENIFLRGKNKIKDIFSRKK
jgi:hypothetical protein